MDESKNTSEHYYLTQVNGDLTSLDPIKGNDGSINQLNTNMYVRLVNLTDDDNVVFLMARYHTDHVMRRR